MRFLNRVLLQFALLSHLSNLHVLKRNFAFELN